MTALYTLASIIQGEASNPSDQFGVASTIYNRLQAGFTGSSGGAYGIATAAGQFSAYPNNLQTPSPYATTLAQALLSGNISDYGDTGNALYYNAPGYNSAYASGSDNSYGVGTNQYSDVYNSAPSSSFILPQASNYTGGYDVGSGATLDNAAQSVASDPYAMSNDVWNNGYDVGSGSSVANDSILGSVSNAGTYDPNSGVINGGDISFAGDVPSSYDVGSGISSMSGGGLTGGVPVDPSLYQSLPDFSQMQVAGVNAPGYVDPTQYAQQPLPKAVVQAGDTASSGFATGGKEAAQGVMGGAQTLYNAVSGGLQSLESFTSTAFVYVALAVLGIIFVAFGLGMFPRRVINQAA